MVEFTEVLCENQIDKPVGPNCFQLQKGNNRNFYWNVYSVFQLSHWSDVTNSFWEHKLCQIPEGKQRNQYSWRKFLDHKQALLSRNPKRSYEKNMASIVRVASVGLTGYTWMKREKASITTKNWCLQSLIEFRCALWSMCTVWNG